jgi:hypothetical protein
VPSEEGRQVLELLAQGKIDPEQAYRLLRALGDVGERPQPPSPPRPPDRPGEPSSRGRVVRIRVTEKGKPKVNVAIPLPIARLGKLGSSGMLRGPLQHFGIDLDALLKEVETVGRIVDINDDDDRVEIIVE